MDEKVLGDYRIIRQLGSGSLGASYLVEQRFLKKQFLLKILPEELAKDRHFIRRFEEETGRLASLEHPRLVKIHNISLIEGRYCLITDYVEGHNLGEWLSSKREMLQEQEILSLLRQLADVLDYIHAQNVIHGAIKFNNLLIQVKEEGLQLFLANAGLLSILGHGLFVGRSFKKQAEALGNATIEIERGTEKYRPYSLDEQFLSKQSQTFLQNYAFLAPEQKKIRPASKESDRYAFGLLAYYLLTGLFPEGYFPMPSEGRSKSLFDFDCLIKRTLAADPEKRIEKLQLLFTEADEKKIDTTEILEGVKKSIQLSEPILEKESSTMGSATTFVMKKSLEASTALLNPPKDEGYAEALKAMLHRDPVVTHYQPQKRKTDNLAPIQTEMAVIEAGYFTRGSSGGARDEMPQHQIYLKKFAMDIHPVTNEQFVRFLEYMGGEKDENYNDLIRLKDSRLHRSAGVLSIESGYAKHPVVGVTWYGAVSYAQWLNKRLPTEAEWEVAASGGLERATYPTGENIERGQANFFSSDTTAVKSYSPNGYGLYDMAGNVYEWCHDWYGYNYYEVSQQEPHDPQGPVQGVYRVLRGGCWKSLPEDLRVAHRHRNNPGTVNGTYGFRCASTL